LTVLRLHEQTSPAPFEVWIAIGSMAHLMRLDHRSLRIAGISPAALAAGMESSQLESPPVRVISAAKTEAGGKVSRRKSRPVVAASRASMFSGVGRLFSRASEDSFASAGR
jgi:hypothetical protein